MSAVRAGAGFTLVELLLAMALAVVLMALTLPFVYTQKRLWERQEEDREGRRALVGALSWLTRDLEQAGYHGASPPLARMEPALLAYVLSRDGHEPEGFSPDNRRLVTVWLDGRDLKYRIQTPLAPPASGWERGSTQVLASGLAGMRCRALDGEGVETADAAAAALVECTLTGAGGRAERALARLRTAARRLAP
ncbi:MAG TPA: prepilin-type N-terminal cleavage/methylation domain-containing protein [Candidatus Methanoperedens sp.]|nr:prepilin-type N-terminal cleavage/methylation domain-containing protein [Candidatus Methanoperedens sp.]